MKCASLYKNHIEIQYETQYEMEASKNVFE